MTQLSVHSSISTYYTSQTHTQPCYSDLQHRIAILAYPIKNNATKNSLTLFLFLTHHHPPSFIHSFDSLIQPSQLATPNLSLSLSLSLSQSTVLSTTCPSSSVQFFDQVPFIVFFSTLLFKKIQRKNPLSIES